MIKAKVIYSNRGDFALLKSQDSDEYFISVLIPNFYPNSHFDVSKDYRLDGDNFKKKDDIDYMKNLAEKIRKNWKLFSDEEIPDIKIVK